jgi:hypothetical protein
MPRPKNTLPSYLPHARGTARVAWTDATGTRRFKMLPGKYDSLQSRAAYGRFVAELDASPATATETGTRPANPSGSKPRVDRYSRCTGTPTRPRSDRSP